MRKLTAFITTTIIVLSTPALAEPNVTWGYHYGKHVVSYDVPESAVPLLDESFKLNSIAKYFDANEDFKNALFYYNKALQLRIKAVGSQHPLTASIMSNIGTLYWQQEKYSQAEFYLEKAAESQLLYAKPTNHDYQLIIGKLIDLYKEEGKTKEASALKKKAHL